VDVLGHEDVTEEKEPMSLSKSFECVQKDKPSAVFVQVRETVVTAEGDEVVVAFGLVAFQTARHEVIVISNVVGPHPSQKARWRGHL